MPPQAVAKAAVGEVVYRILRGEQLVTVTAHKPQAATRGGGLEGCARGALRRQRFA